jgi:hypothetical protein
MYNYHLETVVNKKLSKEHRVFLLQKWWETSWNSQHVIAAFIDKFPGVLPPSRQVILNLNKRFEQTGTVADLTRNGRPRSVMSEENLQIVVQALIWSHSKSVRRTSRELGIS